MQNTKEELTEYLNCCQNCYCAVSGTANRPDALYINTWQVFDKIIMIAIDQNMEPIFRSAQNLNVSFAFWSKLEGYQIKGSLIGKETWDEYFAEIETFKTLLPSSKSMILSAITKIYTVTPGKQAGKLLFS